MLSTCSTSSRWLADHPKLEGISLMDHLFNRLNGAYPNKWRANFRDDQAINDWKTAWAEAFDEDGIALTDIATGIRNCRRMFDWPPSLSEFLRACRPGLDAENSFHEAVQGLASRRKGERGTWSHPAIYHATIEVGQHDMLNCTYGTLKNRWDKALTSQLSKSEWAEIPDASLALPEPKKTELTNAQAQAAMNKMGAGGIMNKSGRDHKSWAKRILDNPKGRSPVVMAMARAAVEGMAA